MKTRAGQIVRRVALSLLALNVLLLAPLTEAATVFSDDFEDGQLTGWLHTAVPGSRCCIGEVGVELHNSSQMAFAKHTGSGLDSLSMDFNYLAGGVLSFDMHAVATLGYTYNGTPLHSSSGVTISFLNFLNAPLGSISLVNATNPSSLGPDSTAIDDIQHDYTATMSDFAAAAGLGAGDPITKLSLEFFATAAYSFGGNIYPNGASSASVWFDNVTVNAVPIPPAVWLFGSGVLGLLGIARRKRSA